MKTIKNSFTREDWYSLGADLSHAIVEKRDFSIRTAVLWALPTVVPRVASGVGSMLFSAFSWHERINIPADVKRFIAEYKAEGSEDYLIRDVDALLLYIKENDPETFQILEQRFARQENRLNNIDAPGMKRAYDRNNRYIVRQLSEIQATKVQLDLFAMIEGFVANYAESVRVPAVDLTEFKDKYMRDELSMDDILMLCGSLEMDAKSIARLWDVVIGSDLMKLGGYMSDKVEAAVLCKDLVTEELVYFAMALTDELKVNNVPFDQISAQAKTHMSHMSHLDVLSILSELPEPVKSSTIVTLLNTNWVKKALSGNAQKASYYGLLTLLETLGEGDIEQGVNCARLIEKDEIDALETIQKVLSTENPSIDDLPLLHEASKKIDTLSMMSVKLFDAMTGQADWAVEFKRKVQVAIERYKKIDEQTVQDIVFLTKTYQSPQLVTVVEAESAYGSGDEEELAVEQPEFFKYFEMIKRISNITNDQADELLRLNLVTPGMLDDLRNISDDFCERMKLIIGLSKNIPHAEDKKKATLLLLKEVSQLTVNEREILIRMMNRVFGLGLPVEFADSRILDSIGQISNELYDKIEVIRLDLAKIANPGEDSKLKTLQVMKKINDLGREDRAKVIVLINSVFDSELPVELSDSRILDSIGQISDELYGKIEVIRLDLAKIANPGEDSKLKTLQVIKKINDLGRADRAKVIVLINSVFNSELPVELSDSRILDSIGQISDELYGKIEVIRKEIAGLSEPVEQFEGRTKGRSERLLSIVKKISDLGVEDRAKCLDATNAIFGAELPAELADIDALKGIALISDELYAKIEKVLGDVSLLSRSDDKAMDLLRITEQISAFDGDEWAVCQQAMRLIKGEPLPPRVDVGLYGKLKSIFKKLKEVSELDDKFAKMAEVIFELDVLTEDEKDICTSLTTFFVGDGTADMIESSFVLLAACRSDDIDYSHDDLGTFLESLQEIIADMGNIGNADSPYGAVLLVAEKIDALTPVEKRVARDIVGKIGSDDSIQKLDKMFTLLSLCNEKNVGVAALKGLVDKRKDSVHELGKNVLYHAKGINVLSSTFKGSVEVSRAKDVFIVTTLLSLSSIVILPGVLPIAITAISCSTVYMLVRFGINLYHLNNTHNSVKDVSKIMKNECKSMDDVVDFLTVYLKGTSNEQRNPEMVKAAEVMRDNVKIEEYRGVGRGILGEVSSDIKRVINGK